MQRRFIGVLEMFTAQFPFIAMFCPTNIRMKISKLTRPQFSGKMLSWCSAEEQNYRATPVAKYFMSFLMYSWSNLSRRDLGNSVSTKIIKTDV